MNFDEARQKHAEWRVKFRSTITRKETLDADAIAKDDRCALGKWLHGEAMGKYSRLAAYSQCVQRHAHFHVEASKVAQVINAGRYDDAQALLGMGSGFSRASADIQQALDEMEKQAGA